MIIEYFILELYPMQSVQEIQELCKSVRHHILASTTHAGSGHPTSSLSAVELVTTLFFLGSPAGGLFHYNIDEPHLLTNDRFILSKGHASPLLYALYRVAGALTDDDLTKLREHNSRLEGHPSPLSPYVDVETGSLGQGLSIGLGMALGLRLKNSSQQSVVSDQNLKTDSRKLTTTQTPRVFVLMGDSEFSEGQIYEALQLANHYKANNLVGILDVNRLGQRGETMLGWDLQTYAKRIDSFGWKTVIVDDGHDIEHIQKAFGLISEDRPTMIIAKTVKGKGVSFLENKDGQHGKPVPKEKLDAALAELGKVNLDSIGKINSPVISNQKSAVSDQKLKADNGKLITELQYSLHENIATRQAYGDALVELGKRDENVVVLDAEVSNSTFADKFRIAFPKRYFEMFIAEQNMVSVALGLSKVGFKPYVSSFASFLTRAFDQIRMSQYSYANLTFCGSHVGVSIGEDGSSQMGLEDISMFRSVLNSTVLYPSDANSTIQLINCLHEKNGVGYVRTTRAATPILYSPEEAKNFKIGGSKILHQSPNDKAVVIAAGITLHEALKAYAALKNEGISIAIVDLYSIKPLDTETVKKLAHLPMVVVEDHYPAGGIGEAVLSAISNFEFRISNFVHLCVRLIPHSGSPEENLRYAEIDASAIVRAIKNLLELT